MLAGSAGVGLGKIGSIDRGFDCHIVSYAEILRLVILPGGTGNEKFQRGWTIIVGGSDIRFGRHGGEDA